MRAWLFLCACLTWGCSNPCDELLEVCDKCPTTGDGPVAAESCRQTVENGNEDDCEARLDEQIYEARGCK